MKKLVDHEINFSFEEKLKQIEKEKAQLQTRKIMTEQEYMHVYSRYKAGEIAGKDFQTFRKDYLGREKMLEEQAEGLEKTEKALNKSRLEMKKMFADWLQFKRVNKLTEKMIETCIIKEYADDGYSGRNFERPAVRELLEDVRSGKVYGILVKDFSRFGRNLIEVGDYIETLWTRTQKADRETGC